MGDELLRVSKGREAGGVAEVHITHQWTKPTYS